MKIGANAFLAFVIEMVALGVYLWAPFAFLEKPVLIEGLVAAVCAGLFVGLWAIFCAPKSTRRLKGVALTAMKVALLLPAVVLLTCGRSWVWFVLGLVIVLVNVIVEYREYRRF